METKEAITKLNEIKVYNTGDYAEAIDMAIQALEIVAEMDSCESCKLEPVYEVTLERA